MVPIQSDRSVEQTGQNPQIQLSYPRRLKAVIAKSDIWVWTYNIVIVIKH